MEKNGQKIAEFWRAIEKMPPEAQNAINWLISNFDAWVSLVEVEPVSDEEIRKYKKLASERGDYIMLFQALYKKIMFEELNGGG